VASQGIHSVSCFRARFTRNTVAAATVRIGPTAPGRFQSWPRTSKKVVGSKMSTCHTPCEVHLIHCLQKQRLVKPMWSFEQDLLHVVEALLCHGKAFVLIRQEIRVLVLDFDEAVREVGHHPEEDDVPLTDDVENLAQSSYLLTPPRSRSSSTLSTHSQLVFVRRLLEHEADARLKVLVSLLKLVAELLHLGAKVGAFATEAENHRASKHQVNECEKKQGYHSTVPPPPPAGIQARPSERRSCILCS